MQNIQTEALTIGKEAIATSFGNPENCVQGLWAFVGTSTRSPRDLSNRGILTLQAGRILGGHLHRAYAGTYETHGEVIRVRLETWLWNPMSDSPSLFGVEPGSSDFYEWTGNIDPMFMSGELTSNSAPGIQLTAALMRICDLDGAY